MLRRERLIYLSISVSAGITVSLVSLVMSYEGNESSLAKITLMGTVVATTLAYLLLPLFDLCDRTSKEGEKGFTQASRVWVATVRGFSFSSIPIIILFTIFLFDRVGYPMPYHNRHQSVFCQWLIFTPWHLAIWLIVAMSFPLKEAFCYRFDDTFRKSFLREAEKIVV